MMKLEENVYWCPACKLPLLTEKDRLYCENNHEFDICDSIPDLTWPKELTGNDAIFFEQYKEIAQFYDQGSKQLFETFFEDENKQRSALVSQLDVKQGAKILEISTGTGLNLPYLREKVGPSGEIHALDLSPNMLKEALKKVSPSEKIKFVISNASYLPYTDNTFDAIFHIGGINTFTEIKRAFKEFVRVVKPGGNIVISDEGMAPWLLNTEYGDELVKLNGLYKEKVPLELLPQNVQDVTLRWVMGNAFYVLDFKVATKELKINYNVL